MTGLWASSFGTPNWAAHGGFCSVNMAAAGQYTVGGSFWEFGEPDWSRARYMLLFGVAEDHDSNPIKLGLSKLKERGAKIVSLNPVQTGYSAIADEWIGVRPGTDGLLVLAIVHELLKAEKVDLDYLGRMTDAAWLVVDSSGSADHGLYARDGEGRPLAFDEAAGRAVPAASAERPSLLGAHALPDGRRAVPAFQLVASRYLDASYAPEAVAERCGVPAETIRRLAARSPTSPSSSPWSWSSPGPTPAACGTTASSAGPSRCTRCAGSRPTRTASTPAAPCTCSSS
jgi:anaerobic selenocysteine-containing dehydrogenase